MTARYVVTDLQAVEPDELTKRPDVTVEVADELDSMGFPRVTIVAETIDALTEYVWTHWGADDPAWFEAYVLDRIEVRP